MAWASALLVSTDRAKPHALNSETSNRYRYSRFLCIILHAEVEYPEAYCVNMQRKLKKWTEDTLQAYINVAEDLERKGFTAPSFYTQSDLTKLTTSPEVLVMGINPGSEGEYLKQICDPEWVDENGQFVASRLLEGNGWYKDCCNKKPGLGRQNYWNGVCRVVREGIGKDIMSDASRSVLTNATFFNSGNGYDDVATECVNSTIVHTVKLIEILRPEIIIILGCNFSNVSKDTLSLIKQNVPSGLGEISPVLRKVKVSTIAGCPAIAVPHISCPHFNRHNTVFYKLIKYFYEKGVTPESIAYANANPSEFGCRK